MRGSLSFVKERLIGVFVNERRCHVNRAVKNKQLALHHLPTDSSQHEPTIGSQAWFSVRLSGQALVP